MSDKITALYALLGTGIIVLGILVFVWLVRDRRSATVVQAQPLTIEALVALALVGGGSQGDVIERLAVLLREHFARENFIPPDDLARRLVAMEGRMGNFVTPEQLAAVLNDRLRNVATQDDISHIHSCIARIVHAFNRHTHRHLVTTATRRGSWLWAILTGLIFAGAWITLNRLVPTGYIASHVGTRLLVTSAWHSWWFTAFFAVIAFLVGLWMGSGLSRNLRREETTGPDTTPDEVTNPPQQQIADH